MAKPTTKKRRKSKREIPTTGKIYITAGFNNTLITITDNDGNTLFTGSAGKAGFKGSRKSTPYAATTAAIDVATKAKEAGLQEVAVFVNGPGAGRIASIKALKVAGIRVSAISDVTRMPHNGCRPKKRRRV
jgi:small subunit ribosomal protein S11